MSKSAMTKLLALRKADCRVNSSSAIIAGSGNKQSNVLNVQRVTLDLFIG